MEGYERKEGMDNDREEIYSKAVRAGKRKAVNRIIYR